jgi:Sec-independent protein translocase protein TatA
MRLLSIIFALTLVFALFLNSYVFCVRNENPDYFTSAINLMGKTILDPVDACIIKPAQALMEAVTGTVSKVIVPFFSNNTQLFAQLRNFYEDMTCILQNYPHNSLSGEERTAMVEALVKNVEKFKKELKEPASDISSKLIAMLDTFTSDINEGKYNDEALSCIISNLKEKVQTAFISIADKYSFGIGHIIVKIFKVSLIPLQEINSIIRKLKDISPYLSMLFYGIIVYALYLAVCFGISVTTTILYIVFLPVRLVLWIVCGVFSLIFGVSREKAPKIAKKKLNKIVRRAKHFAKGFFGASPADDYEEAEESETDALVSEESEGDLFDQNEEKEAEESQVEEEEEGSEPAPAKLQGATSDCDGAFMALTSSIAVAVLALLI